MGFTLKLNPLLGSSLDALSLKAARIAAHIGITACEFSANDTDYISYADGRRYRIYDKFKPYDQWIDELGMWVPTDKTKGDL